MTYTISIRSKYQGRGTPIFHGTLETIARQKFEFRTLAELNRLLCDVCGWIDAPCLSREGGERTSFNKVFLNSGCPSDQNPKEEMK